MISSHKKLIMPNLENAIRTGYWKSFPNTNDLNRKDVRS